MGKMMLNPFYKEQAEQSEQAEQAEQEKQDDRKSTDFDLTKCLLCKAEIKFEERRFLLDVQYHYTVCLWNFGAFQYIVPQTDDDLNARLYFCAHQGCSMRKMKYKEYCVHEGISHRKTQLLLSSDSNRPELKKVAASLNSFTRQ